MSGEDAGRGDAGGGGVTGDEAAWRDLVARFSMPADPTEAPWPEREGLLGDPAHAELGDSRGLGRRPTVTRSRPTVALLARTTVAALGRMMVAALGRMMVAALGRMMVAALGRMMVSLLGRPTVVARSLMTVTTRARASRCAGLVPIGPV